jgi:EAL domain-containing protein (putative c-di-GMP-specific phosphodiesterase class I)
MGSEAESGMATNIELATNANAMQDRWRVLLVDDEPQIHEITRLILANVEYAGLPVELHSAYSASEAKTMLRQYPDIALVLLDVVMESDEAGLALVHYIREELDNSDIQLVLRTGQPGVAPEREVILKYDLNGYFLKTEVTAQKLYSIVISSLRAYQYIRTLKPQEGASLARRVAPQRTPRRAGLEDEIIKAIKNGEAHLSAQPQLHLASDAIVGVEVVAHLRTSAGIISPSQLANTVRDAELRLYFDEWLLKMASGWARTWQSLALPGFFVSVPVLTDQVWDCRFLSILEKCLTDNELPRGTLDLEVAETLVLGEQASVREALAFMQDKGVSVTLVDFGSGMISLPHLQRLLPNRLKIHRTFVRNVANDQEKSAIARTIIALAHTLGITAVADGIASELDYQFFKWEGCDIGQGDFLGRSMAVAELGDVILSSEKSTH